MPPKPAVNRVVVSISLPLNHVRLIDSLADQEDRTRSGMIKHIISEYARRQLQGRRAAHIERQSPEADVGPNAHGTR